MHKFLIYDDYSRVCHLFSHKGERMSLFYNIDQLDKDAMDVLPEKVFFEFSFLP